MEDLGHDDWGHKTQTTPAEFEAYIDTRQIYSQCKISCNETAYFVFGEPSERDPQHYEINAISYCNRSKVMRKSRLLLFYAPTTETAQCVSTSPFCFVFTNSDNDTFGVNMLPTNGEFRVFDIGGKKTDLLVFLSSQTAIKETGLARIRRSQPTDFTIQCSDGSLGAHKLVLMSLWPFFESMIDSGLREASENVLELDQPKSTVAVILRYLHGEDLDLEFEDAANLVVVAQAYLLPELLQLVEEWLKLRNMDFKQALLLWRKSCEVDNDTLKALAASEIEKQLPGLGNLAEQVKDLSQEEFTQLMQDVCVSMGQNKRRKVEETRHYIS